MELRMFPGRMLLGKVMRHLSSVTLRELLQSSMTEGLDPQPRGLSALPENYPRVGV